MGHAATMTEIRFYHLMTGTPAQALFKILTKALSQKRRVVVRTADVASAERLTQELWTVSTDRFLPHGTAKDGDPDLQPIWITDKDENPNGAEILILTTETDHPAIPSNISLVCTLFDGRKEEELAAARRQWKTYKDTYDAEPRGMTLTYWQQTPEGEWVKKA